MFVVGNSMKGKIKEVLTMKGREELEPYLEIIFLELVIKAAPQTGIARTNFEELSSLFGRSKIELVSDLKKLRDLGYVGLELNKETYDDKIDAIAEQHPAAPIYIDIRDYKFYVDKLRALELPVEQSANKIEDCYAQLLARVFEEQPSSP